MRFGKRWRIVLPVVALVLAFGLGRASARNKADSTIIGVCGVGGVLTESGMIYQYHPQEKRWMTIDEAFKRENKDTKVLPLPVPAQSIKHMESWGFLVTNEGRAWLYDLESQRWRDVGTP